MDCIRRQTQNRTCDLRRNSGLFILGGAMKVNVVTVCSGYDAMCCALKRLRKEYPIFDFNLLAWAEVDPTAIQAHNAIHPEYADRNLGDIKTADYSQITQHVNLLIYSTPCQSVSRAGKRKGMKESSDAASALIWHTRRAIEELKPDILILENVRGMIDSSNIADFHKWQNTLVDYGYKNYTKVIDSAQMGVAQHRERVFMVSLLSDEPYFFPEPIPLEKRLKDYLEPYGTVPESYYLTPKQIYNVVKHCERKQAEGCGFNTQFVEPESGGGDFLASQPDTDRDRQTDF